MLKVITQVDEDKEYELMDLLEEWVYSQIGMLNDDEEEDD